MTLLVDYSFARPDPKAIKAAGYEAVMRYISGSPNSKNLSAAEAKTLLAAGLTVGLVWETVANRAGAGHAAGAYDAGQAEAKANALGYPAEAVIFFAVDFDAQPNTVSQYFEGVLSAARRPVGVYGSLTVVEAMHAQGVPYMWQACAWSRGAVSKIAHLYQRNKASVAHPIPGTDENIVMHPFPMWGSTPAKHPPAPPKPPSPPAPPAKGQYSASDLKKLQSTVGATPDGTWGPDTDDRAGNFRNAVLNQGAINIRLVQAIVGTTVDGVYGPATRAAVAGRVPAVQRALKVAADGSWGPTTEKAYQTIRNQFHH